MSVFGAPDREEKSVSLMADFILKVTFWKDIKTPRGESSSASAVWAAEAPKCPQGFHFPSLRLTQDKVQENKREKIQQVPIWKQPHNPQDTFKLKV